MLRRRFGFASVGSLSLLGATTFLSGAIALAACGGGSSPPSGEGGTSGWRSVVGSRGVVAQTHDDVEWSAKSLVAADFRAVTCVNASIGWAVGAGGIVLHTTDAGATWSAQDSHLSNELFAVRFVDASRGVVAGGSGAFATTRDGGSTWSPVPGLGAATWRAASSASDASMLVVVGDGGALAISFDGGASWTSSAIANGADLRGVGATWAGKLVAVTDDSGEIWESNDGAATFHAAFHSGVPLEGLSLSGSGRALAVGAGGSIFAREVSGEWHAVPSGTTESLHGVLLTGKDGYASSPRAYAAGDHGALLASDDYGASWRTVALDTQEDLFSLDEL